MSEVSYSACPKCGHAPLPQVQVFPVACPACSIVLAKFRPARLVDETTRDLRIRRTLDAPDDALHDGDSLVARARALLFYVPPQVSRLNWQGRIIVLAVFGLWTLWIFRDINIPKGNPGSTGAESDGHDWQNIFGDLGLLKRARGIGVFFGGAGRAMMLLGLTWGACMLWLQKARLSDAVYAGMDQER